MRQPRVFVYIEAARDGGYYSRWVERTQERVYVGAGNVEPYWVEMLRATPEAWDIEQELGEVA